MISARHREAYEPECRKHTHKPGALSSGGGSFSGSHERWGLLNSSSFPSAMTASRSFSRPICSLCLGSQHLLNQKQQPITKRLRIREALLGAGIYFPLPAPVLAEPKSLEATREVTAATCGGSGEARGKQRLNPGYAGTGTLAAGNGLLL